MTRKTYMYWALPLFTLASCIPQFFGMVSPITALIISGVILLACWAVVWLRLFMSGLARPEFSILTVFPLAFFCYLKLSPELLASMQGNTWSTFYLLSWLVAGSIGVISFGATDADKPPKGERDTTRVILSSVTILFCLFTWISSAKLLFLQN